MDMKTGKGFLEHIAKYICGVLIFIVIITMTSCSDSFDKKAAGVDAEETEASEETDELSRRLEQYKAFLRDEVSSEDKKEKQFWYLRDFCNMVVPEETEAGIRYALFDMTGDQLPELHVLTDISYSIHTIENDKLITWYQGDRYNSPLNNGMILWKGSSESAGECYMVLDSKGAEVSSVWFGKSGNDYRFATGDEDIKLSKRQWEKLKKPFLAVGSDQIIWRNISDIDFDVDHQDYYKRRGDQ